MTSNSHLAQPQVPATHLNALNEGTPSQIGPTRTPHRQRKSHHPFKSTQTPVDAPSTVFNVNEGLRGSLNQDHVTTAELSQEACENNVECEDNEEIPSVGFERMGRLFTNDCEESAEDPLSYKVILTAESLPPEYQQALSGIFHDKQPAGLKYLESVRKPQDNGPPNYELLRAVLDCKDPKKDSYDCPFKKCNEVDGDTWQHLRNHTLKDSHFGGKLFKCMECDKRFNLKVTRDRHQREQHRILRKRERQELARLQELGLRPSNSAPRTRRTNARRLNGNISSQANPTTLPAPSAIIEPTAPNGVHPIPSGSRVPVVNQPLNTYGASNQAYVAAAAASYQYTHNAPVNPHHGQQSRMPNPTHSYQHQYRQPGPYPDFGAPPSEYMPQVPMPYLVSGSGSSQSSFLPQTHLQGGHPQCVVNIATFNNIGVLSAPMSMAPIDSTMGYQQPSLASNGFSKPRRT